MATQIFIEPELESLNDHAKKWEELCTNLDLKQQLKKIGKKERMANPYTKLDPRTERVYKMLCPQKELYTSYTASTFPLEVLQEIKRCKENEWFASMVVWYDDQSPDPFLIGVDSKKPDANKFVIARWGDELLPFEQLLQKAIARYRASYKHALDRLIADCEHRKQNIEGEILDYIDRGYGWQNFTFPYFDNPII